MIKNLILISFASLFLVFAFPKFSISLLAFIGFIPLFFALHNKSPKKAFLISYLCGFLFYLGTLHWLYHVTVFGLIALSLYLGLYFGIFGFLFNRITFALRPSLFTLFLIPLIWTGLEWLQAHLFSGFGWALLGYSQYRNTLLIQIADFSGVYGVSFVIMMMNVAIWRSIRRTKLRSAKEKCYALPAPYPCGAGCTALYAILILIAVYSYGFFRLNQQEIDADSVKISVIQGNIPQEAKWDPRATDDIIKQYTNLTRLAAFENPDLIIWPETSFPGFFIDDEEETASVLKLAKEIMIPILAGANTTSGLDTYNSAVLISSKGEIESEYNKIHLVPFGEYVPFSDRFPLLRRLVLGELGGFTAGHDFTLFEVKPRTANVRGLTSNMNFAALICFEDIFPAMARRFVQDGAEFLVVITNDAWYGKSGAAYQHAACSVFRAIENRVPVVRSANTGYSCFIDSKGKIYDSVEEGGSHLFITGHKTSRVTLLRNKISN
ncbi:MAG: apolipoprotein N-acyltransferase [Candidatus Omnitrophica bacterium]|nr:apolipoprotein N-acyltransferase [Candidatus Omnitrophota bacterium]MBU4149091.1 apolipoprotein N-acyltransferase [Candidatus Omnitrophota bacterium]